ncbi:uncharacterized protein LOC114938461 [Nylanderia fulva]|uniref:uncharacterized protein LOC114938461 n=1 Tax=Nylanderia fulva TaxID=613905 RepID=UPI0010FB1232|nr:uncharacterized protein LOC114938461 [Nylanderia fulva]XP_029168294.1 uncharacterized protein LOC114938461 [Nylanderia fulva]
MGKLNKPKCVKREGIIKNKSEIKNNPRGEPINNPEEKLEEKPVKESKLVIPKESGEENENRPAAELGNDLNAALLRMSIRNEPDNDPENEPEDDPRDIIKCIPSFNSITLEDIKDILYELHEYFDEFQIEIVACPDLTREPYNLEIIGMSGNTEILEVYTPYDLYIMPEGSYERIPIEMGTNYFISNHKPGMVLKIRVKGRKTNYNIITLIQNILHKRLYFKIGLGGVLLIQGGHIKLGKFPKNGEPRFEDIDCNLNANVFLGSIVNDPVIIEGQHDGLFYTNDRYMFFSKPEFNFDLLFLNDITPEETEYVGYFHIAERMFYFY